MGSIFSGQEILIYLDETLGYAENTSISIEKLRPVFKACSQRVLKLNLEKRLLTTDEVQFCGRVTNKHGVRFYPRQYEALANLKAPTAVGDLM